MSSRISAVEMQQRSAAVRRGKRDRRLLDEAIERIVTSAPEITDEQRARVAAALGGAR